MDIVILNSMNISFFDNDWNIENNNRFIDNSFSEEDLSIRHNPDFHLNDYEQIKLFQEPKREDIFTSNPSKMTEDNNFDINFSFDKTTVITSKILRFETKIEKKALGRKKMKENIIDINNNDSKENKSDNNNDGNLHDKFREDNIMRKIKYNISEYIIDKLNSSLKNKKKNFRKLDSCLNEKLKKDFNINLMERTIMDILLNFPLNNKYKKDIDSNKTLINKILEENREIQVINILNMKYIDIINEIRYDEENLYFFLEKIRDKEKVIKQKYGNDIEKYVKSIKDLLMKYDSYFKSKSGRKSKSKKNDVIKEL